MLMMIELNWKEKSFKSVIKLVNHWVCLVLLVIASADISSLASSDFFFCYQWIINFVWRWSKKCMHTNYFLHIFCVLISPCTCMYVNVWNNLWSIRTCSDNMKETIKQLSEKRMALKLFFLSFFYIFFLLFLSFYILAIYANTANIRF